MQIDNIINLDVDEVFYQMDDDEKQEMIDLLQKEHKDEILGDVEIKLNEGLRDIRDMFVRGKSDADIIGKVKEFLKEWDLL